MLKFTKMHGLGNDYIFIYDEKEKLKNLNELSVKLSNRNLFIGGDGIIVISKSNIADYKMRIFNLDGSEAKMCGNGIRCVAKYLYDNKLVNTNLIKIETLSGIKDAEVFVDNNKVSNVKIKMGKVDIKDAFNTILDGKKYEGYIVNVGNPHLVFFTYNKPEDEILKFGKDISTSPAFKDGINVEFIRIIDNSLIEMSVYERGTGITYACGTGSTASYFLAYKKGFVKNKGKVKLKYGCLEIEILDDIAYMTGSATTSYEGIIDI